MSLQRMSLQWMSSRVSHLAATINGLWISDFSRKTWCSANRENLPVSPWLVLSEMGNTDSGVDRIPLRVLSFQLSPLAGVICLSGVKYSPVVRRYDITCRANQTFINLQEKISRFPQKFCTLVCAWIYSLMALKNAFAYLRSSAGCSAHRVACRTFSMQPSIPHSLWRYHWRSCCERCYSSGHWQAHHPCQGYSEWANRHDYSVRHSFSNMETMKFSLDNRWPLHHESLVVLCVVTDGIEKIHTKRCEQTVTIRMSLSQNTSYLDSVGKYVLPSIRSRH